VAGLLGGLGSGEGPMRRSGFWWRGCQGRDGGTVGRSGKGWGPVLTLGQKV